MHVTLEDFLLLELKMLCGNEGSTACSGDCVCLEDGAVWVFTIGVHESGMW